MGPRTVAALFALAALLTGYYWLFEREPDRPKIGPVFPRLEFADIVQIELAPGPSSESSAARSGPVRLLKKERDWWIERPAVPAHVPRVESIAMGLVELQRISDIPLSEEASTFDPGGPEETVRFKTRQGEEHLVEVGRDHPDSALGLAYAKVDGRSLFLTRKSFKLNLQSRLDDLRSRALFPMPKERVARLDVSGGELYRKALHREGADDFRFEVPGPAPGDRGKIAQLLDDLSSWQAESFVRDEPGDLAPYGLDRPRTTIAITGGDGVRIALEVGDPVPEKEQVYVRWADKPFVMTASRAAVERLERPAEELYSEFVLQLGAEEISEIVVRPGAGGGFAIRLSGGAAGPAASGKKAAPAEDGGPKWEIEEPGKARFTADADRIASLIGGLKYLAIKRYLPRPAPTQDPAAAAALSLEVRTDTGALRSLSFLAPAPGTEGEARGTYHIVSGDEPFLYIVVTRVPRELGRGAIWFKDRRISRLDPEGLREFEIALGEEGLERTWVLGRPGEDWTLAQGGDFAVRAELFDGKLAKKVAALLGREEFQVEEWAPSETDLAAREIDRSRFRIRISLTNVYAEYRGFQRLYIGQERAEREGAGAFWARVDEPGLEDLPFLLDRSRVRAILDLVDHLKEISEPADR